MSVAYLCPKCGSGKTENTPVSQKAKCLSCGWEGTSGALLVSALNEVPLGLEATDLPLVIAKAVSEQYLLLLAKYAATAIGKAMLESGVIGGKESPKLISRLIRSATLAAHTATLTELELIQREPEDG